MWASVLRALSFRSSLSANQLNMGCGKTPKVVSSRLLLAVQLVYPKSARLKIKERNSANEVVKITTTECSLPPAIYIQAQEVQISHSNVFVSACVLPGIDPKGTIPKPCQDRCTVAFDGTRLLVGAYDGHGGTGHDCAEFVRDKIERNFKAASLDDKHDPKAFLVKMTEYVNDELLRSSIDTQNSGTTATLLLIDSDTITTACVGDSRACLGTAQAESVKEPNEFEDGLDDTKADCLLELSNLRKIPSSQLTAVQLSKESKPNDPDEMFRVFKAGGVVERMKGPNGEPYGPFRLLGKGKNTQGLAMSRSLGDFTYKDFGVIGTPMITQRNTDWNSDYICIAASDGVWDVLSNTEVVNFVEAYRSISKRTQALPSEANIHECTIAQLLCEEARLRWLTLVQEEDVLIDDISAIVVELKPHSSNALQTSVDDLSDSRPLS